MLYSIVEMAKENGLILDNYIVNVYEKISQISMHCYPGRPTLANRPWVHGRIRYANSMIPQGEVSTADEYTLCHGNRVIGGIGIAL